MASHLADEILTYLGHQVDPSSVSRFLLRDYITGHRAILADDDEIEEAIQEVEQQTGWHFPEGSLAEAIKSLSADQLKQELILANKMESIY